VNGPDVEVGWSWEYQRITMPTVTVKLDNDQRGSILKVLQSEVVEGQ